EDVLQLYRIQFGAKLQVREERSYWPFDRLHVVRAERDAQDGRGHALRTGAEIVQAVLIERDGPERIAPTFIFSCEVLFVNHAAVMLDQEGMSVRIGSLFDVGGDLVESGLLESRSAQTTGANRRKQECRKLAATHHMVSILRASRRDLRLPQVSM